MGQAVHIQGDGGSKAPNYTPNVADVTDNKELKVTLSGSTVPLPTGAATEATLASALAELVLILTQLQSTLLVTHTGVNAIPVNTAVKSISAGDNNIGNVDVASSALPTGAATEAKQLADNHQVTANAGTNLNTASLALEATLASIKSTDGIKKITDALPAGTNLLGKVGIDQTTDGTTNKTVANCYNSKTSTYRPLKQDGATDALQTIDYAHHEIHSGSHFFYTDYDSDVDTASPKYYRITTPDTAKWAHMLFTLYSEGVGTWQLFENPTVNAAGTTATVFNNDRNSATTATTVIAYDATSTADGTLLKTWRTGSGTTAPSRVGTESRNDTEIILKQNEDYFLKFTPDADNAKTKIELEFYEHTNN